MQKRNSYLLIIGAILVIVLGIVVSNMAQNSKRDYLNEISVDKYYDLLKAKDESFIYIGKGNCSACDTLDTELSLFVNYTEYKVNYLNTDKMTKDEYKKFKDSNALFKNISMPLLLIVKDNKIVDNLSSIQIDYQTIGEFFLQQDDPAKKFNTITIDQYISLLNGSEKSYIYVGRTGCIHCQHISPVLTKIINETGIKINYLNIEKFTNADFEKLANSNEIFAGEWGTPTLLIVQNGKVLDNQDGAAGYTATKNFLLEK